MFQNINQENTLNPLNMFFYTSLRKHYNEQTGKWEVWLYKANGSRDTEEYDSEGEADSRIGELKQASSFIEISDVQYNLFWVSSISKEKIVTDSKTEYRVVYNRASLGAGSYSPYLSYETEAEADAALQSSMDHGVGGFVQKSTYDELPADGNVNYVYIAKDTGQTYYYDSDTGTYVKTGTAGRTGIYVTTVTLAEGVGNSKQLNKTDLTELVAGSVPYMDGSDVIGPLNVRGVITTSDSNKVTVRTVVDTVYENFIQVATLQDLPSISTVTEGELYYVKDIKEFRVADKTNDEWITPYEDLKDRVTTLEGDVEALDEREADHYEELTQAIADEEDARETADSNLQDEIDDINDMFFVGRIDEWDEHSQQEKDDFLVAVVEGYANLSVLDQQNLQDALGTEEPVISDMYRDDAIQETDEIIGGNE